MIAIPFPARAMIALAASALLGALIGTVAPARSPTIRTANIATATEWAKSPTTRRM